MKVKSKFILTIIMIISTVALTSCDAIDDVTGSGLEGEGETLVFAGLNWDSALVQSGVARYIVENGYGYETDMIEGATVPLFHIDINESTQFCIFCAYFGVYFGRIIAILNRDFKKISGFVKIQKFVKF